jgi:gamma-D-glutamyl-L-lysine dipeptidyl-peptidase
MRFLTVFILMLLFSGCKPSHLPVIIQKDIDSISHKYVPDTREGICTFDLSMFPGRKILIKGETNLPIAKVEIMTYLARSGYELLDSLLVLPDPDVIRKTWGLVSISVCNIKKTPSHSSELVSQAIMGTPVKILKKKSGWVLVQTPEYYIGWINSSDIEEFNEQEITNWRCTDRVIFIRKSGDILGESGKEEVVSDIVYGALLEVESEKNGKYGVVLPDGRRGVVNRTDVIDFKQWSDSSFPAPEKLILFAKSLLGSPYHWGGTSTKAFDCSGFVKTIYLTSGIILARDASEQFLYGKPVEYAPTLNQLERGDLIFFGNNNNGKKRITHVGMYIGDTEFIHCSGMVRINSLDSTRSNFSKFRRDGMMGVKRIIGTESGKGAERIANHTWYMSLTP